MASTSDAEVKPHEVGKAESTEEVDKLDTFSNPLDNDASGTIETNIDPEEQRLSEIMNALNSDDPIPEHLKPKGKFRYEEGWDFDKLEEELKSHPFFMTEMPKAGEPLPPLIEAFQQLKYSSEDNSPNELATNYKEDGLFHFKLKKYRIATTCFSEAIRHAENVLNENPDATLTSQLYNNRAAAQFHVGNYRSCLKDCEKALAFKPDYIKPLMKALECCVKLEKWDKALEFCDLGDKISPKNAEIDKIRMTSKRRKRLNEVEMRKSKSVNMEQEMEFAALLNTVKGRGVKVKNDRFLKDAESGKRVSIGDDGRLSWPVLFYYPQFSQSDFIEAFHEDSSFVDHLTEILDNDRPHWDRADEYHVNTVDLYFIDITRGGYVKINAEDTIADVLRHERYYLPTNGVPGFFVMARDNEMCKVILERCE